MAILGVMVLSERGEILGTMDWYVKLFHFSVLRLIITALASANGALTFYFISLEPKHESVISYITKLLFQ